MRLYLDSEFTGLHQGTTLISLALVSDDGQHEFYAEFTDYDQSQVNDWLRENVIAHLRLKGQGAPAMIGRSHEMRGTRAQVAASLRVWLLQFDEVVIWGDCLAWDWVLFCELFGGALSLPSNVNYIPRDLSTALEMQGFDPDINREMFAGGLLAEVAEAMRRYDPDIVREAFTEPEGADGNKHDALHDARIICACVQRLERRLC